MKTHLPPHVGIIGAGIIGLSCADELVRRGAEVTLFEKQWPPRGASWAAAGMLAPAYEAVAEDAHHPDLFKLCLEGAKEWPDFAARLERETGQSVGYSRTSSIALATNSDEHKALERLAGAMAEKGLDYERLSSEEICQIEPSVSRHMVSGLRMPSDTQVDNRAVVSALVKNLERHPNITVSKDPAILNLEAGQLKLDGCDVVLIASGWQSDQVQIRQGRSLTSLGALEISLKALQCFGGQMLSVARQEGIPETTLRCGNLYLAPKSDRLVIGATMEPNKRPTQADPETIEKLHRAASRLCPALAGLPVLESWAGVRPGIYDHAPLLGPLTSPGAFVATGHYRNGILLAPITAKIMADMILEHKTPSLAEAFSLKRCVPMSL